MNKIELVQHLANLTFIMDFHEKLGTTKNPFIMAEFKLVHDELTEALEKEDEARKSKQHSDGSEEGTHGEGRVGMRRK